MDRQYLIDLTKKTENFSVFEMQALLSNCLTLRLREVHQRQNAGQLSVNQLRPIVYEDFCQALKQIRAIFSWSETTTQYDDWNNRYGSYIDQ